MSLRLVTTAQPKIRPFLRTTLSSCRRHGHASSAPRAPKARQAQERAQYEGATLRYVERNWPIEHLQAAHSANSRLIPSPDVLQNLLDQFVGWYHHDKDKDDIEWFLRENQMHPKACFNLATTLFHAGKENHIWRATGMHLMYAGAKVGDISATLRIFEQALRIGQVSHPHIKPARQHVEKLAEEGNPVAMLLLSKYFKEAGKLPRALELAEQSRMQITNGYTGLEALETPLPRAWRIIADIKTHDNDPAGRMVAVECGAFHDDDPEAYYYLAERLTDPSNENYLQYMLKAAASGLPDAAVKVGQQYFLQAGKPARNSESSNNYALAQHWFQVALASPNKLRIDHRFVKLYALACAAAGADFQECATHLSERFDKKDLWAQGMLSQIKKQSQDAIGRASIRQAIQVELHKSSATKSELAG